MKWFSKTFSIVLMFAYMQAVFAQTGVVRNNSDTTYVGKPSSSADKKLIFDVPGATDPNIKANVSTGKLQFSNDGTNYKDIGSGGGGSKNFITNFDFEADTSTYSTYKDAAATTPVDGTGGSPTTLTLSKTTSGGEVLSQTGSLKVAKSAANSQGEGFSVPFTVDAGWLNPTVASVSFMYDTSAANYVAGDIVVCMYDVTASALITLSGASVGGCVPLPKTKSIFKSNFNFVATSTSYRLIAHYSSTTATASNVFFDEINVNPSSIANGVPVSEWADAGATVVTGNGTTPTKGTVKVDKVTYRRVGDSAEIRMNYLQQGAGTSGTSTIYYFAIPSVIGLADMNYHYGAGTPVITDYDDETSHIGTCSVRDGGLSPIRQVGKAYLVSSSLIGCDLQSTNLGNAAGGFGTARIAIGFELRVKISGWSGSANIGTGPQIEYACNNSATDATDTTSFYNGSDGCQFVNVTAQRGKTSRFLYKAQPGDVIIFQTTENGGVSWPSLADSSFTHKRVTYNGTSYGIEVDQSATNGTDVLSNFYLYRTSGGATSFGGAGGSWTTIAANPSFKWRIVKLSGAAAAAYAEAVPGVSPGFISANGLKGRTDGATPAAGYHGEYYVASGTTTSTTGHNTQIDCTTSIPLTAGGWILMADGGAYLQPPNTGVTVGEMRILNVTDNVAVRTQSALGTLAASASAGNSDSFTFASFAVISISSTKSYKVQLQSTTASGSPTTGGVGCRASDQLVAMRIF